MCVVEVIQLIVAKQKNKNFIVNEIKAEHLQRFTSRIDFNSDLSQIKQWRFIW